MAEAFKSVNADLGTSANTSIYQCPSSTTALAHTISVPADTSLNPIGGKLVLEAGDQLRAWAGAASDLEIVVSVLEIS